MYSQAVPTLLALDSNVVVITASGTGRELYDVTENRCYPLWDSEKHCHDTEDEAWLDSVLSAEEQEIYVFGFLPDNDSNDNRIAPLGLGDFSTEGGGSSAVTYRLDVKQVDNGQSSLSGNWLCWAASAAAVINYKLGKSYNAFTVFNRLIEVHTYDRDKNTGKYVEGDTHSIVLAGFKRDGSGKVYYFFVDCNGVSSTATGSEREGDGWWVFVNATAQESPGALEFTVSDVRLYGAWYRSFYY